ncbi:MAG TPA: hypothetical protein HA252_04570 [Candidatus Diapherotrites archaeon]|uniref:Nucleotidyltransferase family protein n=1 Tax=Candidatus Iainarchaeum sp. TaxID=3101447 RepID=A0A7J4JFU5_9ARCH|nr:hypothetical protein [Candidatus Diapherotrites archaeon]HIH16651.1 hypothetical protein [Candidatus Diapherotrites archaeon]
MKEFWPEIVTKASWEELQRLAKEMDFVLIGGWAAYLWTDQHKSRDIDLIVSHEMLARLKERYELVKNARLKKYEIKRGEFDVDVYVPFFSPLVVPPEDILARHHTRIRGIQVVSLEALLVLKQAAYLDRRGSIKGKKDEIDLLTLLLYASPDWTRYLGLLKEYGKQSYAESLLQTVREAHAEDLDYLGIPFKDFKAWQKRTVKELAARFSRRG